MNCDRNTQQNCTQRDFKDEAHAEAVLTACAELMTAPTAAQETFEAACISVTSRKMKPPKRKKRSHLTPRYAATLETSAGRKTNNRIMKKETNGQGQESLASARGSASRDAEVVKLLEGMALARKAIIADLERRHKEGDKTVKRIGHSQGIDDEGEPTNYVSGGGEIVCPVCESGALRYSRASYNGHVHARCSHAGCVAWME